MNTDKLNALFGDITFGDIFGLFEVEKDEFDVAGLLKSIFDGLSFLKGFFK